MIQLDEFGGGAFDLQGQRYIVIPQKTLDMADMKVDADFKALEKELVEAQEISRAEIVKAARFEAVRAVRGKERQLKLQGAALGASIVSLLFISIEIFLRG